MKHITLAMALLFIAPPLYAEHEYIPYVQDGNEWVMLDIIEGGYRQYRLGEIENIEGIDYHKIYTVFYSGVNSTFSEPSHWGYVREVDKKVYFGLEENDRLVYDFGAQVGDTIRYDHLYEDYLYYTVVNSIENKYISGKERIVQNVTHHVLVSDWEDEIKSVWIEGIGADEDIFEFEFCYRLSAAGPPDEFNYFYNSLEQIRYPDNGEVIDFSAVSTTPADAKGITLHREGDHVIAVFPAVGVGEAVTLYDTTGRVVASQPLRQGATTATIDIAHLPQGVYIARVGNTLSAKVVL